MLYVINAYYSFDVDYLPLPYPVFLRRQVWVKYAYEKRIFEPFARVEDPTAFRTVHLRFYLRLRETPVMVFHQPVEPVSQRDAVGEPDSERGVSHVAFLSFHANLYSLGPETVERVPVVAVKIAAVAFP